MSLRQLLGALYAVTFAACGGLPVVQRGSDENDGSCSDELIGEPLVFNEIMADNEGALLDDQLETEDYVELVNVSRETVDLADYEIGHVDIRRYALPSLSLEPGGHIVLFADDTPGQGERHLPLKFSSSGETLQLWKRGECERVDAVSFPELGKNDVYARYPDGDGDFELCRYASPGRDNGDECEPSVTTLPLDDVTFEDFEWPTPWRDRDQPLDITEVALPADASGFVELENTSDEDLQLGDLLVTLSPQPPGEPWPDAEQGLELEWNDETLEPGELATLDIPEDALEELGVTAADDLTVSVFERENGTPVTHLDFMWFPVGAALARPKPTLPHIFCVNPSPGQANDCEPLESREVGDRLHALRTPTDFARLAEGGSSLTSTGVKILIDLEAGGVVHLLSTTGWVIHYEFVREAIYGEPHLDRCIPEEKAAFDAGWWDYSVANYFQVEGRRFYNGTLVEHAGTGMHTLEFAVGDVISGEQMRDAFFISVPHTQNPTDWVVRPQVADQVLAIRDVEGTLPIVGPNAPFSNVEFQPLTVAVGYGVLDFVAARDLDQARLGPDVIVVTDDVPNDIPLVGGLITEAFQTPLSHVNVLSQNRHTPNMALEHARNDERVKDHLGELVRLEVTPSGFTVERADAEEANAFWEARRPSGDKFQPRLDLDVEDLVDLDQASIDWLPAVGGKAAQFSELYAVSNTTFGCGSFRVPPDAFAIPVVHFVEHAERSGATGAYLDALEDPEFKADYRVRATKLAEIRQLIMDEPVDEDLLDTLKEAIRERWGTRRVRLRSSSNAEDLPGFNGAGLYTSEGADLEGDGDSLEESLKIVWASLYNQRAHDEREFANIDHSQVAMGVLVHEAYPSERARGVGVSRNLLDPRRADIHYFNAQAGEATVTNPAPGITTEEILYYRLQNPRRIEYRSRSNLIDGAVLDGDEINELSCALVFLDNHFSSLLNPNDEDPYFAIEMEFKFVGAYRDLVIKQARRHPIIRNDIPDLCALL